VTGNKNIDTIIIALSLAVTIGVASFMAYSQLVYRRPLPDPIAEKARLLEEARKMSFPEAYKLDKLIINLPSKHSRLRFLDVEIHLVPFKGDDVQQFADKKVLINDTIINIASAMEGDELGTVSGKILLEERLKKGINQIFKRPLVKEILFTKFIIQ
jgi:flagellar FliL protein